MLKERKPTTSEIWVTLFTPYYTYNRVKHEHNNHTHFACTSLKNLTTLNIEWLHKICNQNFKEQRFEQKQILEDIKLKNKKKNMKDLDFIKLNNNWCGFGKMKHLYVNAGTGTYFDLHRVSITNELKLLVHYSFSYDNVNIHMYIYMN